VVETSRLESGHTLTGIGGSNPSLSAIPFLSRHPNATAADGRARRPLLALASLALGALPFARIVEGGIPMTRIFDLVKDQRMISVTPDTSVLQAARNMTEKGIGAVAVMSGTELVGIFSERDIMTRVVAAGRSPGHTLISEVMTPKPFIVSADDDIDKCMYVMREYNFRHLPVIDANHRVIGIVSLRDVLLREFQEKAEEAKHMQHYMTGKPE
jgi:CBS domain-containing protein